jgi:hypothetical protein
LLPLRRRRRRLRNRVTVSSHLHAAWRPAAPRSVPSASILALASPAWECGRRGASRSWKTTAATAPLRPWLLSRMRSGW